MALYSNYAPEGDRTYPRFGPETILVRQSGGMFFADCPSPGMTQTHRGETLYDLAVNVQLSHGTDVEWIGEPR